MIACRTARTVTNSVGVQSMSVAALNTVGSVHLGATAPCRAARRWWRWAPTADRGTCSKNYITTCFCCRITLKNTSNIRITELNTFYLFIVTKHKS